MDGNRRPASLILAAATLGLVLRLAFAFGYWVGEPLTRDEQEYLSLARSLAAGRGFVADKAESGPGDPFGRAPGYPAFLALTGGGRAAPGQVPASVQIAQAVVGAAGVLVLATLAGRLAGPRAAVAAAVLGAVHPPLVALGARAFSEAVFWPLGLAVAWAFNRMLDAPSRAAPRLGLACGVLTGVGVLVRPALLMFLPLATAWLLWRRRPGAALACLVGAALVVGPWTARTYAHYGRLVLVATEGGVTFWTGNHALAKGDGDLAANPDLARARLALRREHAGLSEEAMEPVYYRAALDWMRSDPLAWIGLEVRKVFYVVVPVGPSYTAHSTRYYAASALPYLGILVLAGIGLWRAGPARGRLAGLWLLVASAVITCLVFFPSERFRIPVIDPALIVAAGAVWARRRPAGPDA